MFTDDTASILLTLIQLLGLIVLIAVGSVALGALSRYLLGRIDSRPAEAPAQAAEVAPQQARRPVPVLARSSRSARRWTAAQERSGRHASARWALSPGPYRSRMPLVHRQEIRRVRAADHHQLRREGADPQDRAHPGQGRGGIEDTQGRSPGKAAWASPITGWRSPMPGQEVPCTSRERKRDTCEAARGREGPWAAYLVLDGERCGGHRAGSASCGVST